MQLTELGDFLRSRRARLSPVSVGLLVRTTGRRVAGLRREEIALLAGVSVDYYTRLEQARAANVSDQVLEAVAGALRLNEFERRYMFELTRRAAGEEASAVKVRPALRAMVDAYDSVPAILHNDCLDVVAINRMAKILIDDFAAMPPAERNVVRWMFLDPRARTVYVDWQEVARQTVAVLRSAAARGAHPDRLDSLVAELVSSSGEFATYWSEFQVRGDPHGRKRFFHEKVGIITLNYEALVPPADTGLSLMVYTADKGSPSEEKLRTLAEP
ncbi:helix-turn-helix transcriptional regulator [Kribbella qitaiheensis]|uniref:helix-turn-helix transcriptional regulator n=1 Tax=Kribbella qitaiheensis TaxID=1544730 RepID=UPI003621811A